MATVHGFLKYREKKRAQHIAVEECTEGKAPKTMGEILKALWYTGRWPKMSAESRIQEGLRPLTAPPEIRVNSDQPCGVAESGVGGHGVRRAAIEIPEPRSGVRKELSRRRRVSLCNMRAKKEAYDMRHEGSEVGEAQGPSKVGSDLWGRPDPEEDSPEER